MRHGRPYVRQRVPASDDVMSHPEAGSRRVTWSMWLVLIPTNATPFLPHDALCSTCKRKVKFCRSVDRIQYMMASLAFRALSGLAPDYLAGEWQLSAGCCFRTETPAVRGVTRLPCATSD